MSGLHGCKVSKFFRGACLPIVSLGSKVGSAWTNAVIANPA